MDNNTAGTINTPFDFDYNAQLTSKKMLAKIATKEQKPTVFCFYLIAC